MCVVVSEDENELLKPSSSSCRLPTVPTGTHCFEASNSKRRGEERERERERERGCTVRKWTGNFGFQVKTCPSYLFPLLGVIKVYISFFTSNNWIPLRAS